MLKIRLHRLHRGTDLRGARRYARQNDGARDELQRGTL